MSSENATQSDAEEVVVQEYVETIEENDSTDSVETLEEDINLSPREQAIEALVAKRHEQFEEESNVELSSEDRKEQEIEVEEETTDTVSHERNQPVWEDNGVWYTTVKVDGEEVSVPFDDLRSSHQKDKASQKRFEEAASYGKQVQEREAQLNQYIQNLQQNEQKQSATQSDVEKKVNEQTDPTLIKQYHDALYEDDAEKAAELFKALTNAGRTTGATPNVDEAVERAMQRFMMQQQAQNQKAQQYAYQKSLDDAVKWFDSEYSDIANSPELRSIADNKTIGLTQQFPDWSPKDILKEAAESTRQWAKESLSPEKNERATRKKKIVKQPRQASASARIGEDEPAPQTSQDIIEEMKRQRGQFL